MTDVAGIGGASPPSIRTFARLWFAATGFALIGTALGWELTQYRLERDPTAAPLAMWAQPVTVGLMLVMTLLQWWLVTRRASIVGKWMVVIVAGLAVIRGLFYLQEIASRPVSRGALLLAVVFDVWAAAMLFREDARVWFGDVGEFEE